MDTLAPVKLRLPTYSRGSHRCQILHMFPSQDAQGDDEQCLHWTVIGQISKVRDTWKDKYVPKDLWKAVYDQLEGNDQTQDATRCLFHQCKGSKSSFFLSAEMTAQRRNTKEPKTHNLSSSASRYRLYLYKRPICLVKQLGQPKQVTCSLGNLYVDKS